jgi:putative DNA primase/helicase
MVAIISREPASQTGLAPIPAREYNLTDLGNARRFAQEYATRIRYVHGRDQWLLWDSTRWAVDRCGGAMRAAKRLVRKMYKEAGLPTEPGFNKALAEFAIKCEARQRLENMLALAKSEPEMAIQADALDCDPWLLNCKNCTLDLRTMDKKPHDPADLITRIVHVEYDDTAQAPIWHKFLRRVFNDDPDLEAFIRRAVGCTLTGVTRDHVLFFMLGSGRNGKSTFIETIIELLSEYSTRLRTESLVINDHSSIPNDIATLHGARLCVTDETEQDQRMAEKLIKALTGGDQVRARFLHQEFFSFSPTHKLWMFGNHKLTIRGTDTGIWSRIRLIPFNVTIPEAERDLTLRDKLRAEFPGILAWAVRGCYEWQDCGLGTARAVEAATIAYRSEMDVIGDWLDTNFTHSPTGRTSVSDLYASYVQYMEVNGERAISRKRLGILLRERGLEAIRTGNSGAFEWQGLQKKKESVPF